MSLRLRLLLTLVPLFILGLAAADVGTYRFLDGFLVSRVDQQVLAAHGSIEASLDGHKDNGPGHDGGPGPDAAFPQGTYGELRSASGIVLKSQGFYIFDTASTAHPVLPANLKPGTPSAPNLFTAPGTGGVSSYRVYVDTARDNSGNILIAAIPLDDVQTTLNQLLAFELLVSGAVVVVVALVTLLVVRRSLQPLARMGDTARSIVATDLHQRVEPATDRTEVGRLGLALNSMLGQLEAAFAARAESEQRLRHFVSDASHELRTPLTSMRGYAELLRRNPEMDTEEQARALRRIEDEAGRLGVLVDDLLLLARLDQGRALEQERVDVEALVSDACADARVADPARSIRDRAHAPLVVVGDNMRLRQVLSNLLRNALVHTPPGTPIEVELRLEGNRAVIEVIDHGPGIAASEVEKIFERFHRADPERSRDRGGSGLGLSIVSAVVAAHHGRLAVLPTRGGGATFRIELPLAPSG